MKKTILITGAAKIIVKEIEITYTQMVMNIKAM